MLPEFEFLFECFACLFKFITTKKIRDKLEGWVFHSLLYRMKLLVFKNLYVDRVITLFDKHKFTHFVDGIHLGDVEYLRKNFRNIPHKFVYLYQGEDRLELDFGELQDYEKPRTPDFVLYFDEFEELDPSDWFFLQTFFERVFNGLETPMLTRRREFLLETSVTPDAISWGIFTMLRNRELGC
jgi:uncharacterized protein YlbG (UPF0298 family)